jgi:hypothetical protein
MAATFRFWNGKTVMDDAIAGTLKMSEGVK